MSLLTAAVVALALVLGGGTRQGLWSDAVVQLSSLLLIGALLPRLLCERTTGADLWPLLIVAAAVFLPVLQLVRMPPTLWTLLPGRETIATVYQESGVSLPWLPISLDPAATWRGALSLLPPIAVFFATLQLGRKARRSLSLLFIAVAVVSVLLGLAQLMQGPASPLRFHPITNVGSSVGFFANRNHFAALLYAMIPFTAAWMVGLVDDRRPERVFGLAVCLLVYAALALGLGIALSRTGIVLAVVAALSSLLLAGVNRGRIAQHGFAIIGGAILLGTILIIQFAFFDLLARLDDSVLADYRFRIFAITIEAARAFQPIGSGFGTFVPVYQMFEVADALLPSYVNHAHNDWLEIWLEGGWLAVAAAIGFLAWLVFAGTRAWRTPLRADGALDRALQQAASITVVLLLLHSVTDYPLRTTALMTLLAYCCALLIPPLKSPRRAAAVGGKPGGKAGRPRIRRFSRFRGARQRATAWRAGRAR